jgi:dTDP-4-amino-4,6-dideoxygalactose transaminase
MIPFFDYRPAYREIQGEIDEALARVLASGRVILGPEVGAFEEEIARFLSARHAVAVASGTDALTVALRALEVGEGDEVLTVANAGVPAVAAIRAAGARPRFVDVRPDSLLMDPGALEAARTERTRCLLPVHLYGQPAAMDEILAFASRQGLPVIEDCAQAQGTELGGRAAGTLGQVGCFSFYPTKNLGAYGDGGLCVTGDDALAERLRMVRQYGFRGDRHAHREGINSRLDEMQAAVLRVKLRHLPSALEAREDLVRRYREGLEGTSLRLMPPHAEARIGHHLFVVRSEDRDRYRRALEEAGIGYGLHYPEPVHLMEAYRFLGARPGELPVTERACGEVLSLPLYPGLEARSVARVIDTLTSAD